MSEQQQIDAELDAGTRRSFQGLAWALLGLLLYIGLWCATARAETSLESSVTVQLKRGTSNVTLVPAPTTLAECEQRRDGLIAIDAQTKFSGTSTYSCIETRRAVVTFSPNPAPVCPPQPADETRAGVCPTGTSGTWTQTQTYSSAPSPTCWIGSGFLPIEPPAGACVAPPPPPPVLTAPANLTGTASPNQTNPTNFNIKLTWGAVAGATEYEVYRCTGATCSLFKWIADTAALEYTNTNLPPGTTFRYRVRAWKPDPAGPYSTVFTITTPTTPPPPPPATGTALIRWTPPTTNTDGSALTNLAGWRIEYGPVGIAGPNLNRSVSVSGPALTSYVVEGLTAGPWAFAVRAVASTGAESVPSAIATKAVP